MIDKLFIKYFQSHKNTVIEFCKGVNIIIGISGYGKTSIIRAIKLLTTNRPSNFRYHSNFAEEELNTEITMALTDPDNVVEFKKNDKTAVYIVDGEPFRKFSRDVPSAVKTALNMTMGLNIASQEDPPYLIESTPVEVGKAINRVIRLERVMTWVSRIRGKLISTNDSIKRTDGQIEDTEKTIEELAYIQKMDQELERVEAKELSYDELDTEYVEVQKILNEIMEVKEGIGAVRSVLALADDVQECEDLLSSLVVLEEEANAIQDLFDVIKELDSIEDFSCFEDQLLAVENTKNICERLVDEHDQLQLLIAGIDLVEKHVVEQGKVRDVAIDEYREKLREAKQCPTCRTILDEKKIKEVLRSV